MKKQMIVSVLAMWLTTIAVMAQDRGGARLTTQERVKAVNEKLADFKLAPDKLAKTDSVFTSYYTAVQTEREAMIATGGTPDRSAMRDKMLKLNIERDEQLKLIFTDEQFKKWKDDIEPAMRPQRQNRQR
jgi:periplasmic protein CpxP/Spy